MEKITSVDQYLETLPNERKDSFLKLRNTILENLPEGFEETISYGMIGYVVPLTLYPAGYHCNPKLPLPFISIASQKNFTALYHMGIYADEALLNWFTKEYANSVKVKLDMGKSCIRFKKPEQIPYELIGKLVAKISPEVWIDLYEKSLRNS